jgi:hypothetical protein
MMGTRSIDVVVVVWVLTACQASAPPDRTARAVPPVTSCKPEAPIAIEVATRALGPDELEVIARATPTRDVATIELQLALPPHAQALTATSARFGVSGIGTVKILTARVRVDQRSSTIAAIARVPVDDVMMARTASVAIGAPATAPRTRTYALPDGDLAREVQP